MLAQSIALFLLSVPLLIQAGPVSDSSLINGDTRHFPNTFAVRGDDNAEDSCKDSTTCLDNGKRLWDKLKEKLDSDKPQDETKWDGLLDKDYEDNPTRDGTPDASTYKDLFEKLKLDFNKHFAEHTVRGKDDEHDAYQNMYNTNQGVSLGVWNFKEYDKKNTIPFSEVFYQCYLKECDDKKELKKFKFMGVHNIINEDTLKVVTDLYEKRKQNKIRREWVKWTLEENENAFKTILGTPKMGFLLRMLTDHPVAFGKRIPKEVWTHHTMRAIYVVIDEYKKR